MMGVMLRIFKCVWMRGISGSDGTKILSINDHTAFLHQPVWSVPALNLYVPHEILLVALLGIKDAMFIPWRWLHRQPFFLLH